MSDRRPRSGAPQRRRPVDDVNDEAQQPRRDPRRRTAFVPRQSTPRAGRPSQRGTPAGQRSRPTGDQPGHQPQQPPYRAPRQEPIDDYEEYDDYEVYEDDRILEDAREQPARGATRRPRATRARDQPQRRVSRRREQQYADDLVDEPYLDDYDEGYEDSFIDEDDWYEEEAAAGAYTPPRQRAPRQGRSMPRPSISVSRPNIPRPVVPARVKEAALVQDERALILGGALLLSTLALALLTMNRVDSLAPSFPTHISASGLQEAFRSEQALWQLPLMAGALLLMNVVIAWFLAQYSRFSSRLLLGSTVIVHVLIWVAFLRIAF